MLTARRVSIWFSEDYTILQDDVPCGRLRPDSGGRFLIELGDAQYEGSSRVPDEQVHPYGRLAVTLIDLARQRVAAAYTPGSQQEYNVPFNGRLHRVRYSMTALFALSFPLHTDGEESGRFRSSAFWRDDWTAELPPELPLFLQVFLLALVFRFLTGAGA